MFRIFSWIKNFNVRKILICALTIIGVGCISLNTGPGSKEIALEVKPLTEPIKGSVDFVGLEVLDWAISYKGEPLYPSGSPFLPKYDFFRHFDFAKMKIVLSLFIKNLDVRIQNKIHNFNRDYNVFGGRDTAYTQTLFHEHTPIYDDYDWRHIPTKSYSTMASSCLGILKKSSNANYFLVVAIRPLDVQLPDEKNPYSTMKIALIIVLYNNQGIKEFSKIYEMVSDQIAKSEEREAYFRCSLKLLETYGSQINRELSFLSMAEDAKSPTLENLY